MAMILCRNRLRVKALAKPFGNAAYSAAVTRPHNDVTRNALCKNSVLDPTNHFHFEPSLAIASVRHWNARGLLTAKEADAHMSRRCTHTDGRNAM